MMLQKSIVFIDSDEEELQFQFCKNFKNLAVDEHGNIYRFTQRLSKNNQTQQVIKKLKLKPQLDDNYVRIHAYDNDGNKIHTTVQRVVYDAFHDDLDKDQEIDHIDGNRKNNKPENLRQISKELNSKFRASKNQQRVNPLKIFNIMRSTPGRFLQIHSIKGKVIPQTQNERYLFDTKHKAILYLYTQKDALFGKYLHQIVKQNRPQPNLDDKGEENKKFMTLSFGDLRISINIHDLHRMERNKEIQTEYKDIINELSSSDEEELEEDFSGC